MEFVAHSFEQTSASASRPEVTTQIQSPPTSAQNVYIEPLLMQEECDDKLKEEALEEMFATKEEQVIKKQCTTSKKRKYDPNMELSFSDFCKLMGYDEMKLIIEETASLIPLQP